jgi:hypothetical protein
MTKIKGKEATKLFCDSQAAAVDRIEEIQKNEKISATSGGLTAISSKAGTCRRTSSIRRWMLSVRLERPSIG